MFKNLKKKRKENIEKQLLERKAEYEELIEGLKAKNKEVDSLLKEILDLRISLMEKLGKATDNI